MRERIDRGQPQPLYVQVAEAIRYRIATGEVRPGMRLPSLRRAAQVFRVNVHTVRRAYDVLAEQGLIELRNRASPCVLRDLRDGDSPVRWGMSAQAGTLGTFLSSVLREGEARWGLSPAELVEQLEAQIGSGSRPTPDVQVVECSATQAADLARQLEARYAVRAHPWSLERDGEPPEGYLLATYFHYNDVRQRWPLRDLHFVATRPDGALRARLTAWSRRARREGPLRVIVCEREAAMARNLMADLAGVLPVTDFAVTVSVDEPEKILAAARGPVLFAPRVWAELTEDQQAHPHAIEARYVFDARDLEAVGRACRWRPSMTGAAGGTSAGGRQEA